MSTRIYSSHNEHDYIDMRRKKSDTERTGVCPGAASTWCKYAHKANYQYNPCASENLPGVKKLTTEYVYRVNPRAEITKFLETHMNETMSTVGTPREKIIDSYRKHYTKQRTIEAGNGQLKLLLNITGIVGLKVVIPSQKSELIVRYIIEHEGIYLIFCGGHFMGASSKRSHLYFYDNQNGLYKSNNAEDLYDTVKKVRKKERDWNEKWYAYRCYY